MRSELPTGRWVQGQITPVVHAIRQALLGVLVLNSDESGLRVMKLLQWLHVACTDTLVWMARHAKRGRPKQSKATNLLGRLREHAQDVWRFAGHALVPFTNNAAEQLMLKLKIVGTFCTEAGADTFCAIRSSLTWPSWPQRLRVLGPGAAGQTAQPRFN